MASFSVVSVEEVGTTLMSEFSLSVIVKIHVQSKPSSSSNGQMKSKAMELQLVFEGLVTGLQKDPNQTGLRLQKIELTVWSFDF